MIPEWNRAPASRSGMLQFALGKRGLRRGRVLGGKRGTGLVLFIVVVTVHEGGLRERGNGRG